MSRRIVVPVALSMMLGVISGCSTTDGKGFSLSRLTRTAKDVDPEYAAAQKSLDHPERAFLSYANWKADIGQVGEARRSYENVLSGSPNNIDAMLGLARVELKSGRTSAAEKRYLDVLSLNPSSGRVLHSVGQFYAEQKRLDEAIDMFGKSVAEEPTNPSYRFDLGVVLTKAGQINEGLSHLALTVGEPEANYNVGYLLNEMGKPHEALPYLKQAIAMKPSLKAAHELLAGIHSGAGSSPNVVNAAPTIQPQTSARTVSMQNFGPVMTSGQPQQQSQQYQVPAQQYQVAAQQQVQMPTAPVMPPIPTMPAATMPAAPTTNGYRPPQPASAAVPLLPPQQQQQPPAMPQARNSHPARGLQAMEMPTRRQVNQTIRQVSATQAAPASTGLTPAQLQQLLQATK